jgi:predicted  nucleic acid-binding Zn-ribbon protein
MSRFFIRRISAFSPDGKVSSIDFEHGVNIISGPSNTGKTMVVGCIDYLFGGSREPFDPQVEGYNSVSMELVSSDGELLTVRREIVVKDGNAKPSTEVLVESDIEGIPGGPYPIKPPKGKDGKSYGDILLQMLDIPSPVKIISNQDGKPQRLTPRTFFHQLCIREEHIFDSKTIIDNPEHNNITASINALAYLLYEGGEQTGEYEDPNEKKLKRSGVIAYITEKMGDISERRQELEGLLAGSKGEDVEASIDEVMEEIADVDDQIAKAREESRELLGQYYATADELAVKRQELERNRALRSQYDSDVKRLCFIIEGEEKSGGHEPTLCPFCNSEILDREDKESYIAASKAELEKVYDKIADLDSLIAEIESRADILEQEMKSLSARKSSVQSLISTHFMPEANRLRKSLEDYKRTIRRQEELAALDAFNEDFSADRFKKYSEDESQEKLDAKKMFDPSALNRLSSAVNKAVRECKYPDYRIAGVNPKLFDVAVNNKDKKHEGKGYKAFLNSLFAFELMKLLDSEGKHAPRLLVLDSPILSLKEDVDVPATEGMKVSLLNYIIDNCGDCQVIIAENEIPESVDYTGVNVIRFGKAGGSTRSGFLQK